VEIVRRYLSSTTAVANVNFEVQGRSPLLGEEISALCILGS
jgi:hypothetical protein